MEALKKKLNEDVVKLVKMRDIESRLVSVLNRIRRESLEKLKWYESQQSKLLAIVMHHKSRSELPDVVMPELCQDLVRALAETPDDDTGHVVSGGDVDDVERRTDDARDDGPTGESDGS